MGEYLVYCVFVILLVCTVTNFSAAEKVRGVKLFMHVGLQSGQVFSPLVNIGSLGVTGAALLLGCMRPSGLQAQIEH